MHYLAKKFESYFYILCIYVETYFIYFSYITGRARYIYFWMLELFFLPSEMTDWNLDRKLSVVEQS